MHLMEIVLLVMGLAAFILSFFITEKNLDGDNTSSFSEEEIRNIVQEECERSRGKLDEITDETILYSMEKAERQLEKITSEKMLALGEYSDTILNQINKNHQETVFLSDMLSQNKNDLTILLGQAVKDAKDATDIAHEALENAKKASDDAQSAIDKSQNAVDSSLVAEENMLSARKMLRGDEEIKPRNPKTKKKVTKPDEDNMEGQIELPMDTLNIVSDTNGDKGGSAGANKPEKSAKKSASGVSLRFDADTESSVNNNEKILKLHKQGKSNVAIAKELKLGVGEVKLVIDLFK